jgi:hypothetical protein
MNATSNKVIERNAFLLGWHMGYYQLTLMNAMNGFSPFREMLPVVVSGLSELINFFQLGIDVDSPKDEQEARLASDRFASTMKSNALRIQDRLRVNFGLSALRLYEFGRNLTICVLTSTNRGREGFDQVIEILREEVFDASDRLKLEREFTTSLLEYEQIVLQDDLAEKVLSEWRGTAI